MLKYTSSEFSVSYPVLLDKEEMLETCVCYENICDIMESLNEVKNMMNINEGLKDKVSYLNKVLLDKYKDVLSLDKSFLRNFIEERWAQ